ncbi:hypothetical protein ABZ203_13120 [Streptomyces albidoflavus]|uniref:hypothetical protein n=1 Tax=Streptomyces albidoflavus TaxID=1886 RepID=UPI0033A4C4ED
MNAPDPGRPEDGAAASLRRALHATAGELAPPPYPARRRHPAPPHHLTDRPADTSAPPRPPVRG